MIHATASGRQAQRIWGPLFGAIETRWRERFGDPLVQDCRLALFALVSQFLRDLPDCLPKVGYGLFSRDLVASDIAQPTLESEHSLAALLSKTLLAFALAFERDSPLSLVICANLIRLLDPQGVPVRDLPNLSGVAKNAIVNALSYLSKARSGLTETDSGAARTKVIRLTASGMAARERYIRRVAEIENQWDSRFGTAKLRALRGVLQRLVVDDSQDSPLFQGIVPHADGWRAAITPRVRLPHFPVVTHRGGFPDGS